MAKGSFRGKGRRNSCCYQWLHGAAITVDRAKRAAQDSPRRVAFSERERPARSGNCGQDARASGSTQAPYFFLDASLIVLPATMKTPFSR